MSSFVENFLYLVERNETEPMCPKSIYDMDIDKIISYVNMPSIYTTYESHSHKYEITPRNFKNVIKSDSPIILKNIEADKFFRANEYASNYHIIMNQTMIPNIYNAIDYIYLGIPNGDVCHFIILLKIDLTYIPHSFYSNFKWNDFNSSPNNNLFIKMLLSYAKWHYEDMNNMRIPSLNEIASIKKLINKRDTIKIDQPSFLKTVLYPYQREDVAWMLDVEKSPMLFDLCDEKKVAWGSNLNLIFRPCPGSFDTYEIVQKKDNNNNYFAGGCLANSPGLGKTISTLTLCCLSPDIGLSLVIMPPHLLLHWQTEYIKHITYDILYIYKKGIIYNNDGYIVSLPKIGILLASSDDCAQLEGISFIRVIVDEYHEIYSNLNFISRYKWALTGTPFISPEVVYNTVNFTLFNKVNNPLIIKDKSHLWKYASMYRITTHEDIKDQLYIPEVVQVIHSITLTDRERLMLDSFIPNEYYYINKKDHINRQLAFCMHPNIKDINVPNYCFSDSEFMEIHRKDYNILEETVKSQIKVLLEIEEDLLYDDLVALYNNKSCINNSAYINNGIKQLINLKAHISFVENQLCKLADSINITKECEEKLLCSMCYENIDIDYVVLKCGHIFCSGCFQRSLDYEYEKCVLCKMVIKGTSILTIPSNKTKSTYGTKINQLIKLCFENKDKKIVLYLHTDELIEQLHEVLKKVGIPACIKISEFKAGLSSVLILSSLKRASGICLPEAEILILIQPILGDYEYVSSIERQIIGRLYRIGQKNKVILHRLIIKDSIEEELFMANRHKELTFISK